MPTWLATKANAIGVFDACDKQQFWQHFFQTCKNHRKLRQVTYSSIKRRQRMPLFCILHIDMRRQCTEARCFCTVSLFKDLFGRFTRSLFLLNDKMSDALISLDLIIGKWRSQPWLQSPRLFASLGSVSSLHSKVSLLNSESCLVSSAANQPQWKAGREQFD